MNPSDCQRRRLGLIQLNVRMEAKQKRKRYYVDAAECPISLIKVRRICRCETHLTGHVRGRPQPRWRRQGSDVRM